MLTTACLTLLLHVLPTYRPLIHRLKSADAVAVVELEKVSTKRVEFRVLHRFSGPSLRSAQVLPGHRPSLSSKRSLATFRRRGNAWILQEQAREWIELETSDWIAQPPPVWARWLKHLAKDPESALVESLQRRPFARFAVRDLNALVLDAKRKALRRRVAHSLWLGKLKPSLAESLRHHLLRAAPRSEAVQLGRCMVSAKGCLGR